MGVLARAALAPPLHAQPSALLRCCAFQELYAVRAVRP